MSGKNIIEILLEKGNIEQADKESCFFANDVGLYIWKIEQEEEEDSGSRQ